MRRPASTLPPIVLGMVACGLLSSQMSTISTNLTGVATLFVNDIYKTVLNKNASPKNVLWTVKIMTFLAGAMGVGFAYLIPLIGENVVDAYLKVAGIFDMPFFVITIVFGLLWKRANWQGVLVGYLCGVTAGSIAGFGYDMHFFWPTVISQVVVLIVTPIVSLLTTAQDSKQVDHIWKARTHSEADEGAPFHIIPVSTGGRFFFTLFFISLAIFLAGVVSGSMGCPWAGGLALTGMIAYFLSGLFRLFYD